MVLSLVAVAIASPPLGNLHIAGIAVMLCIGVALLKRRPLVDLPRRWSMVLRPKHRVRTVERGTVSTDARIVAPFSRRECIAYEVGVRYDGDHDGHPSTWALVDQQHVPLSIGASRIRGNSVHLSLRRRRYRPEGAAVDRVQRFLIARGIDPQARGLVLFETIVDAGAVLRLRAGNDGAVLDRIGAA